MNKQKILVAVGGALFIGFIFYPSDSSYQLKGEKFTGVMVFNQTDHDLEFKCAGKPSATAIVKSKRQLVFDMVCP